MCRNLSFIQKRKYLTEEMIIKKAKGNSNLSTIRQLNFWGQSLSDISIISECISLESATFSQNFISSLRCFQGMNNLRELSLARNNISDFKEVLYLGTCNNLIKLWLRDNPISSYRDYRMQVIKIIPNLKILDDQVVTQEEKEIAKEGEYFAPNYGKKRENMRPPSHDPFNVKEGRYRKKYDNYEQNYGHNNKLRRIEYQDISNNFIGLLPGMANEKENYNKYDRFYNKKSGTPGKMYDKYGNGRRGVTPFNNNYNFEDENFKGKNNSNINEDNNIIYNRYERNIPGSAQSHYRKYGNNNPMEISTMSTQQGQQSVVDCVSVLLKGLTNDELLFIVDHIDKKISQI